jgi:monoamine oxidase
MAALAAASCATRARRHDEETDPEVDVVVVGGGLTGLAAARRLLQSGRSTAILEAQRRPGGRVLTLREPFLHGQHAEAGAIFVPRSHEVTQAWCDELGVELGPAFTKIPGSAYFLRERLLAYSPFGADPEWPLEFPDEERALGLFGLFRRYVLDGVEAEAAHLDRPDWTSPDVARLDGQSFADFLRSRGASPAAVEMLGLGYLGVMGDGIESVSALAILRDLAGSDGLDSQRIVGGSSRLPEAMAEPLAAILQYGAEVRALEETARGVRVHFTLAGARHVLPARRAIVTLPTTVLRTIELPSGISTAKRRAIAEVGSTSVTRTYLQCARRFWAPYAMVDVDAPKLQIMDATSAQEGEPGILEGYAVGAVARELATLPEEERGRRFAAEVERIFPGSSSAIECTASHAWDLDPHARGGYAWFRPGQLSAHFAALGAPEGRLHFAGEHTSRWTGWMQGALKSGERAASEALAALNG